MFSPTLPGGSPEAALRLCEDGHGRPEWLGASWWAEPKTEPTRELHCELRSPHRTGGEGKRRSLGMWPWVCCEGGKVVRVCPWSKDRR